MLDGQLLDALADLAALDVPYVEFPDNLHGLMTNPKLFRDYCLPAYQKYTDILHRQGKHVEEGDELNNPDEVRWDLKVHARALAVQWLESKLLF